MRDIKDATEETIQTKAIIERTPIGGVNKVEIGRAVKRIVPAVVPCTKELIAFGIKLEEGIQTARAKRTDISSRIIAESVIPIIEKTQEATSLPTEIPREK